MAEIQPLIAVFPYVFTLYHAGLVAVEGDHSPLRENHRTGEQCSPRACMASTARRYGYEPNGLKGKW